MTSRAIDVIGTRIDVATEQDAVDRIMSWADAREGRSVCFSNVHVVTTARSSPELRDALASADLVLPDGWPVAWAMRRMGAPAQRRISGPDCMLQLLARAERSGTGIYLYGSTPETVELLRARLVEAYPELVVAGVESPPFAPPTDAELDATAERIARSGASIIFVGLGAPKQEIRMRALRERVPGVLLGVGAAFDFHAGTVARAPALLRRLGLEWLHRLVAEPRRLAGRYVVGNSSFIWHIAHQLRHARGSQQ